MKQIISIVILIMVGLLLSAVFIFEMVPDEGQALRQKEYVYRHGVSDIGAINLVASIYLGYRLFDTLGETVVLLLAVSGIVLFTTGGKS
ncbi:MAG: hypothetical protein DRP87_09365 [Spirochaetes bacterium]|nr:MAG: hypothetical protein DRP87_09365 [Spirochaetota bacterium]